MIANPPSILLVDDNDDDVLFMKRAAASVELTAPLRVVTNGQEAIDYLGGQDSFGDRVRFPLPNVVLLDLKLPRKSGLEVLEWIREQPNLRPVVVIILSTSREPRDIDRAFQLGANAYLVKPASFGQLVEIVRAIKLFWITFNEFASMGR